MSDLFWLSEAQVERLRPFFPKSRGKPRVDDRRVLSGILYMQRNGLMWKYAPGDQGPPKPLCNRWKRWSRMDPRHAPQALDLMQEDLPLLNCIRAAVMKEVSHG